MLILVDQDGVLADFEVGFLANWRAAYPEAPFVPVEQRTMFRLSQQYPDEWRERLRAVHGARGFFRSLAPVPGAVDALREMRAAGHDVFICTSPLTSYEHCVLEKHEWVEQHLGRDWVRQIILTKDKTLVVGDVLIDDNPEVTGLRTPDWTHVRFHAPYNAQLPGPRLDRWADWRAVLEPLVAEAGN